MSGHRRSHAPTTVASLASTAGLALLLSASAALLRPAGIARAGEDVAASGPKPRILFDGKTLEGWKPTKLVGSGAIVVSDGAVVLAAGRPMTGITSTLGDLPTVDYELRYQAMRRAGSDFFAAATFPVGKSFLTFVNGGWGGNVTGLSSLDGADASENETSRFFKYEDNRWYTFRVRVTDAMVRCWIDDKAVVAVEYKGRHVATRVESHASQPLGFATWETAGAVRKVEVRGLTPGEIAASNTPVD